MSKSQDDNAFLQVLPLRYRATRTHGPVSLSLSKHLINVKRERSGTCYSAADMSQTPVQKRFTISEMAAD